MKCAWQGCQDYAPERGDFCAAHLPGDPRNWKKRASDRGAWCWIAQRLSDIWNFIDARDIDKHAMAWAVFAVTCYQIFWVMEFVWDHPEKPGLEVGAIVAALMLPWTPVQAAVISWYFNSRKSQ